MSYPRPPLSERLLGRVTITPAGCWEWQGHVNEHGYGVIRTHGRTNGYTHRVAWALIRGPIPEGLCVLHRCDNRRCVNVGHLFLGTRTDNARDREAKGRGTPPQLFCKRGHAKTPENSYRKPSGKGGALCRTCGNARTREWNRRHAA